MKNLESEFLRKSKRKRLAKITAIIVIASVLLGIIIYNCSGIHARKVGGAETIDATMEIRCDKLADNLDALTKPELKKYIPKDGVILAPTKFRMKKGATAFDLTRKACDENDIQFEYKKSITYNSIYVKGINYLYEFSAGKKSGWMYMVNGKAPEYGSDQFKLKEGDEVLWYYVVDYTKESNM